MRGISEVNACGDAQQIIEKKIPKTTEKKTLLFVVFPTETPQKTQFRIFNVVRPSRYHQRAFGGEEGP